MSKGSRSIETVEGNAYAGLERVLKYSVEGESYNPTCDRLFRSKEQQKVEQDRINAKNSGPKLIGGINTEMQNKLNTQRQAELDLLNKINFPPENSNQFVIDLWEEFKEEQSLQQYMLSRQLEDNDSPLSVFFDEYKIITKKLLTGWSLDMGQQGDNDSVIIRVKRILSSVVTMETIIEKQLKKFRFAKDENGNDTKTVEQYLLPHTETIITKIPMAKWKGGISGIINENIAITENVWTL